MKKLCSLLLALAMLFALAACGGGAKESTPATDSGTASDTPQESTPSEIASLQRDVVNVGIDADITDFYPWQQGTGGYNTAIWGLFQSLLEYDPDTDSYWPSIMKTYTIAADGLSMEGEIFDNIHDWQGNPITVDDIVFTLGLVREAFVEMDGYLDEIIKIDDYHFKYTFPRQLYVNEFTNLTNYKIVSQKAFEESEDQMHTSPVGTGPYKLTKHEDGYMFTYEKVEDFWQTDETQISPRDRANVNTINWYVIAESTQRTNALKQGTIDICGTISATDLEQFDGKDGYKLAEYYDNLSMTLFCNADTSSPLNDKNLRLAVCYAISTDAILNSVYKGLGTALHEGAPSWTAGYNASWDSEDNYYNYSVDKAKEYLAKTTYKDEVLTILCTTGTPATTAEVIKTLLEQVGIKTEIAAREAATFNQELKDPTLWDIMVKTCPANNAYVQAINSSFSQSRYAWGGSLNFVYDDTLEAALQKALVDSSEANLNALHKIIIDNCYVMGLVNYKSFVVVPDWVESIVLSTRKTIIPGGCVYTEE